MSFLVHVTGRRGAAKSPDVAADVRDASSANRLVGILKDRRLRPFRTFYSDDMPVVCFSEASKDYLAQLIRDKRHEPWAVILRRDALRDRGVQPVRYCHALDDGVDPDDRWRVVRFDHENNIDWYWEREWRWRGRAPLEFTDDELFGIVVGHKDWPELESEPRMSGPDGDVLPHPVVPAWVEGVRRFLWDEETNAFIDIGPRTVPAYEWVSASAGGSWSGPSGGRGASVAEARLVWLEEEDVATVRQEMLDGVRKTLADFIEHELA